MKYTILLIEMDERCGTLLTTTQSPELLCWALAVLSNRLREVGVDKATQVEIVKEINLMTPQNLGICGNPLIFQAPTGGAN